METFVHISILIHILAGCLALLSGLAAILLRNRVKAHKPMGRVYFWCMTVVFITASYVSVIHRNLFLFCIAFFTYYSCLTAYRSLKLRKLHLGQKPLMLDWVIEVAFGTVHAAMILFGIFLMTIHNIDFGIICLVFGLTGARGSYMNYKRLKGQIKGSLYWLMAHIGGMLGSYIGAITAFLVNNNARYIHMPNIIAWLGPAVVLIPLIVYETGRYKKKELS